MSKLVGWLLFLVMVGIPSGYCWYIYHNYEVIQNKAQRDRSTIIQPHADNDSASEVGYIFRTKRENNVREGYRVLIWYVAVPSTGQRFSCVYVAGFDDFKEGDGVTLIHNVKSAEDENSGYIVGLHDARQGKAAQIAATDLDVIMMDEPEAGQ